MAEIVRVEVFGLGAMLKRMIPWLALAAVLFLIFGFSSQGGEASQGMSRPIAALLSKLVPGFAGLDAVVQQQVLDVLNLVVRKGGHTAEYSLLAGCAFWAFADIPALRGSDDGAWLRRFVVAMLFVLATGMADEFNQTFSGGRSGLMSDAVYDFVTSGIVLGLSLVAVRRRRRKNASELVA